MIDNFEEYLNDPERGRLLKIDGKLYCYFEGEIDKAAFETQCEGCRFNKDCTKVNPIQKNVPNDFHAVNLHALYETDESSDIYKQDKWAYKKRRGIAKIVGLAIPYGASNFAVSRAMSITKDAAQACIDGFLRRLPTLKKFMDGVISKMHQCGYSFSAFNRPRNLLDKLASDNWRDKGYAERTALNHPIQSTAGDILKIGIFRTIDETSTTGGGDNFLADLNYDPSKYKKFEEVQSPQIIHTVHDENLFIVQDENFHETLEKLFHLLQVRDVVKSLGVDFNLEADIEYSKNRDWMATSNVCVMRFYVKEILDNIKKGVHKLVTQESGKTIIHEQSDIEKIGNVDEFIRYLDTQPEGEYEVKIRTKVGSYMVYDRKVDLPNRDFIPYKLQ